MEMTDGDFIVNDYGVRIKKCCASCRYKDLDRGGKRICMKGCGHVGKDELCRAWSLRGNFTSAGKSIGGVKKLGYLRRILDFAPKDGDFLTFIDKTRAEYAQAFGSIYEIEE